MKALTTAEFVEKATKLYGDRYDYSKVQYTTAKKKVDIYCREHNTWFKQGAFDHIRGVGCPACIYRARSLGRKRDTEQFVEKARTVHGDRYDYSKSEYKGTHIKLTIICREHGEFRQLATNHISGYGCVKCANQLLSQVKRSSTEEFIKKALKVHEGKYTYSSVSYVKANEPVIITCPIHGNFSQTPNTHLDGSGCNRCHLSGYQPSLPGSLYVLRCGNLTKVGITNREVESRANQISTSYGQRFDIHYFYKNADGNVAKNLESKCLFMLRSQYKNPDQIFDGYTECFIDVDVDKLLDEIRYLSYELTQ